MFACCRYATFQLANLIAEARLAPSGSVGLGGEGASWPLEDKPDRSDRACDRCFSTTIYLISLTRGDRLQDASKLEQIRSREPWFLQAQRTRLTVLDDFSDWILSRLETLDFRPLKIHLHSGCQDYVSGPRKIAEFLLKGGDFSSYFFS